MEANQTQQSNDELIIRLFQAAMSRPEQERDSYLAEACSSDTALYEEVRRRVQWETKLGGFLQTPVVARQRIHRCFEPGELVGRRFKILRVAGEGGMGVVYEALVEKLERRIALKAPHFEFRKRLTPEASKSLQVTHPNVCRVFEIHTEQTETGDVDFLTMEFLEGETMALGLAQAPSNWLVTSEGTEIARQLCAGLKAIHEAGIIHRDLKPTNVMLTNDAAGHTRVVIMDFGISQSSDLFSSLARGTPAYLAPELWKGQPASVQSDIYALGVMLYQMACGRKPFPEDAEWKERLQGPPNPSGVGEPIKSALMRSLQPEPSRRFASVAEFEKALWPKISRRALLAAGVGLAGASGAGAYVKQIYWPTSPVRLAILPPSEINVAAEDHPLIQSFLHDLSYRLKTQRRMRRPVTVFSAATVADDGAATLGMAHSVLSASHAITTRFNGRASSAQLVDASSGKVIKSWAEDSNSSLAESLFALQSRILPDTSFQLALRPEAIKEMLPPAAYPDYLKGLHFTRFDYENAAKAIPYFENVIMAAPNSALGHAGMAEALFGAKYSSNDKSLDGKALTALARAEQLDPESAQVHFVSGRREASGGFWERALAAFQRASELQPNDPEINNWIAIALSKLKRLTEAGVVFQNSIAIHPSYYKPYIDAGMFYQEQRRYDDAERMWSKAVDLNPSHTRARLNLAALYISTGRLAEAEKQTLESLSLKKTRSAYETLASLQERSGRYADALMSYEEAIRVGPDWYKSWAGLALAYRHAGREIDARSVFQKGLSQTEQDLNSNPRDSERVAWCAYYYAHLGEQAVSRRRAQEALTMVSPPSRNVVKRLALAYDQLGDLQATIATLRLTDPAVTKELLGSLEITPALRRQLESSK